MLTAWSRFSSGEITVRTVAEHADPVTCAHGLRVLADGAWGDLGPVDLLVLPGGDTRPLRQDEGFLQRMRDLAGARDADDERLHRRARSTPTAGLLDGRPATTHWGCARRARRSSTCASTADARFVDDGEIVTAAGVSAGIDMALHLVARLESVEQRAGRPPLHPVRPAAAGLTATP